ILSLRRQRISVLLVHHAGQNGRQRGTTKREDPLETVIALRHPNDYSPFQGLRAEVIFEKARGFYGADAEPFEVQLCTDFEKPIWIVKNTADTQNAQVQKLQKEGFTFREIAKLTGISKSTVARMIQSAVAESVDPDGGSSALNISR